MRAIKYNKFAEWDAQQLIFFPSFPDVTLIKLILEIDGALLLCEVIFPTDTVT